MRNATQLRKLTGENLYLAEHDGQRWATNRYWLAPSVKLATLLDKYNIAADATGSFGVTGTTVRKVNDVTPSIACMLNVSDFDQPLTRVKVAGHDAYLNGGDKAGYLALFTRENGEHVAVRADWLDWFSELESAYTYGERYSDVRYYASRQRIGIVANKQIRHGGNLGADGKYVPETWEDKGPELMAIVMEYRI